MPIHGMTLNTPRWPRLGTLRKGAPMEERGGKKIVGKDLDAELRFVGVDDEITADWEAQFGQALITSLRINLPYKTVDECWQAWREHWVAGGLIHRCDGHEHPLWLDLKGGPKGLGAYVSDNPQPCPGTHVCEAKPVGRLEVVPVDFGRIGTICVTTTSVNDIVQFDGSLRQLAMMVGDLRQVPMVLRRVPRKISTPGPEGKRVRRLKWGLHLEIDPTWSRQMIAAHASGGRVLTGGGGHDVRLLEDAGEEVINHEAIAAAAVSLDITAPADDLGDIVDGEVIEAGSDTESDHWTPRVNACASVGEVEVLLGEMGGIEPVARRLNTQRVAYLRIVQLISPRISTAGPDLLAVARQKLGALPIDMPAVSQAMDMVQAREDELKAAAPAVIDGQARSVAPRQSALAGIR